MNQKKTIARKNLNFYWVLGITLCFCNTAHSQTEWIKATNNPVLARDTVISNFPNDLIAISDPWILKEGSVYKMWYTAGGFNYPTDTLLRSRICYATSLDGLTWEKYAANPVLDVSYDGLWDSLGVETVSVIYDSTATVAERYKMWYAGQYFNSYRYDIGYAFSADGINWTKHNTPVLLVGSAAEWDNGFLEGPSVIKDQGVYKMWYCGYDATVDGSNTDGNANIGLAISPDGINWTKHPNNPILITGETGWDSHYVQDPHVLKIDGTYTMWYSGNDVEGYGQQVGLATSDDGINWTKSEMNPVLTKGNPGDWDASTASFPAVIKNDDKYEMWYTGKDISEIIPGELDYYWEIGYASSIITNINTLRNDSKKGITIAPNPVKNFLNIQLEQDLNRATLTIYNQTGQVAMTKNVSNKNLNLDISSFSDGLYFLVLSNGDYVANAKFVKTH